MRTDGLAVFSWVRSGSHCCMVAEMTVALLVSLVRHSCKAQLPHWSAAVPVLEVSPPGTAVQLRVYFETCVRVCWPACWK